jgi:WhiB family redox-sensing transcriptional regulator
MDWMKNAPCIGHGDLFFEESRLTIVNKAREICAGCSVRERCLEHAITNSEVGVWAGLTTNQRRKLVRARSQVHLELEKIV